MTGGERVRLRANLLQLQYDGGDQLRVVKQAGAHLATMGTPRGREHWLYPEEGVYLLERGQATIQQRGRLITVQQGYKILERCSIPHWRYNAYCALKRAGYVAVRPREIAESPCRPSVSAASAAPSPSPLLDAFPSIVGGRLRMDASLHRSVSLVPCQTHMATPSTSALRFTQPHERKGRDKRLNGPLRPAHWPSFQEVRLAGSWKEYGVRRREAIARRAGKGRFRATPSPSSVDYYVYSAGGYAHSLPTQPVFAVKCQSGDGELWCGVSGELRCRLIHALSRGAVVNFVDSSGQSVRLDGM